MANDKVNYITEGTIKEIDAGSLQFRLEPSRGFKCETDGKTAIIFVQENGKSPWVADISTSNSAWSVPPESWFFFEDDNAKVLKGLKEQKQDKEQDLKNKQDKEQDLKNKQDKEQDLKNKQDKEQEIEKLQQEIEKLQQEIKDLQARLEILTQLKRQELLKSLSDLKNNGTTIRIRVEKSNLPTGQSTDQTDIPKAITCDGLSIR